MASKILENYMATHKSRNSTSDNNHLYQDYRIKNTYEKFCTN